MDALEPDMSVEEVRALLDVTEKGCVKNSIRNCLTVLQRDPLLKGAIAKNLLTERVDIVKDIGITRSGSCMTDTDMKYLLLYLEETYGLTNEKKAGYAVSIVAHENSYHPVQDYLNAQKWDGTERIRCCLHHFLGADTDDYTYEVFRLFLMGAIHRAFVPGTKFDLMLWLVGARAREILFFRFLAGNDNISDDLRKIDDDNVYRKLQGHWIIEMSEMLATANARSLEEIRAFLSRQKESYKIPYETHPEDRPRKCVFGGTSNTADFLPLDRTGNRRFLPVMVHKERQETHVLADEQAARAYIGQVWAEAMVLYRKGGHVLRLSPDMEEYLKTVQTAFMPEDTKAGMIIGYLERFRGDKVCSRQLYREALHKPFEDARQWEIREISDIMNNSVTGWKPFSNPRSFGEYGRQRGWEREIPATGCCNRDENTEDGFEKVPEEMEVPFEKRP